VTVDLPVLQQDINAIYSAELQTLQQKAPKEVTNISADQKQEDYYKNFRTNVSSLLGRERAVLIP
jgi:chitin synthase